jgi:enamine deaminase RidA (YjgF/YER057c/UK114 family)
MRRSGPPARWRNAIEFGCMEKSMSVSRRGIGNRMSHRLIRGDTIYLAGQVADKATGQCVGEQTRQFLVAIDDVLTQADVD